jgi:hypothetical protein
MIYHYDSTMPGALSLSGTAGSLKALLKTYLVDGAGTGPVASLTVSAGVALASYSSGHPFRAGRIAQFAGATPVALNGLKMVLSTTANSVTFAAAGVPDGPAAGTITSKLAPAGWTELYPGTANVLALRPSSPAASGCVLRVDDTGTLTARVRGYESMTDVSTGMGPIPLESQASGGLRWLKSAAASADARGWTLIADERAFYLAVDAAGNGRCTVYLCGDIQSVKSGDAWPWVLTGNTTEGSTTSSPLTGCVGYAGRSARDGAYIARAHTGIGAAMLAQRIGQAQNGTASEAYSGTANYSMLGLGPNGPNNGLITCPVELIVLGQRGTLPGLHHLRSDWSGAIGNGSVIEGTDDLAGRKLLSIAAGPPAGNVTPGVVMVDITGPWR